jgi:hypothetical protein
MPESLNLADLEIVVHEQGDWFQVGSHPPTRRMLAITWVTLTKRLAVLNSILPVSLQEPRILRVTDPCSALNFWLDFPCGRLAHGVLAPQCGPLGSCENFPLQTRTCQYVPGHTEALSSMQAMARRILPPYPQSPRLWMPPMLPTS